MSFTSVLGAINAKLGNIELGSPGVIDNPFEPTIVQNLSFTQTIEDKTFRRSGLNVLNITQAVSYELRRLRLISDLSLNQHLGYEITKNIAVTQNIPITQKVIRIIEINISQDLSNLQSTIAKNAKYLPQDLSITQVIAENITASRTLIQNPNIRQRIRIARNLPRQLQHSLGLQHTASIRKAYNKALTSTLNLSQELVRSRFIIGVSHDLTITQSMTKIRVIEKSINHLLLPHQNLNRNIIKTQSITQSIVFSATRLLKFGDDTITVPNVQFLMMNPNAYVNARIRSQLPDDPTGLIWELYQKGIVMGQTGLMPRMPHLTSSNNYVLLYTDNEGITLPAPVFGDSEAETGTLNLRKAMDNTTYTYVKRQNTRKLKYDFELDRQKSMQLRQFVILTNSKSLTLANWKGELWKVKFITNPFSFTKTKRWAPTGEAVTITLEFNGIRIN